MTKSALVVEGGAMRGIFASGVLDTFMKNEFMPYHFVIGVSAGASNLLGYLANSPKRSFHVITKLATHKQFFSPMRFFRGGNLVDIKWLLEQSNQQHPLDLKQLFSSVPLYAAVTNIDTGDATYYQVKQDNLNDVMEATTALPIAYKSTPCFSGSCYTDGGVADSIPVIEAYRRGARDITVILSHPLSYKMKPTKTPWLINKIFSKCPQVAETMLTRDKNYNQSLEFIRNPPEGTTIRVIAPPEAFSVKRLSMKCNTLLTGYQMGVSSGLNHLTNIGRTA